MRRVRIIPVLLLNKGKLIKTVKFKKPNYIGDPVNAVKIFNDKEVDELILLDIAASIEKREPDYAKIEEICSEAFMPFAYGGGINNMTQVDKLFKLGIEKVVLNSVLNKNINIVKEISDKYGAQSVVASIDVRKNLFGKYVAYSESGKNKIKKPFSAYLESILAAKPGELFINSIDKDGTFEDYDYDLIERVAPLADIPLIACGGASNINSFTSAIQKGASAAAAGSLFVYRGVEKGILINYPKQSDLEEMVFSKL